MNEETRSEYAPQSGITQSDVIQISCPCLSNAQIRNRIGPLSGPDNGYVTFIRCKRRFTGVDMFLQQSESFRRVRIYFAPSLGACVG